MADNFDPIDLEARISKLERIVGIEQEDGERMLTEIVPLLHEGVYKTSYPFPPLEFIDEKLKELVDAFQSGAYKVYIVLRSDTDSAKNVGYIKDLFLTRDPGNRVLNGFLQFTDKHIYHEFKKGKLQLHVEIARSVTDFNQRTWDRMIVGIILTTK